MVDYHLMLVQCFQVCASFSQWLTLRSRINIPVRVYDCSVLFLDSLGCCFSTETAAHVLLGLSRLAFCLGMTRFLLIALRGVDSAMPKVKASPCMTLRWPMNACFQGPS